MIGEKVKALRIEKGISQTELASHLFVTRQTISRWERGQTIPNTENIAQLSKFFEVETNHFFDSYTYTDSKLVEQTGSINRLKMLFITYKSDIYIFSLLIAPFFYILIAPLSFISLHYSLKYKKRYSLVVVVLVICLMVYFSLEMAYIVRFLFGLNKTTTEIFIE